MIDKEQAKKEFNTKTQMIIIAIVVFCISVILFSVIAWFLKLLDTKENDKDPKNAPAAARNYMNDTNIDENGNITLGKSIAEWWEELKKSGNKITKYLNSPEELAKLMNAAMALEYPDTREHPDDPIVWENLDINSTEIQGIVKFKRALKDGGDPISMTYVSPTEFQELINKYKQTGSEKDKQEALEHFTMEKTASSSNNLSTGGSPIVEETLKYACSWVGKVPYKSHANGQGDNTERWLPLKEGRGSDCSWFVHWVFEHVGLIKKDQEFTHSLDWGNGGDDGGCPGTVKIGTDLSKASPGDVLWWHFGSAWNNHVAIYLGNNKMVECGDPDGVKISKVTQDSGFKQILHFTSLPTDPTGYFDPDTMTLHSSLSFNNADIAKVPSLNGMVFMGDSILSAIRGRTSLEKNEGVKTMYQSGCSAEFFLGEENCSDNPDSNCSEGGYFNWDKQFSQITDPTGFYLMLGQNFFDDTDHRIERMDRLIMKIRSKYPSCPIYINSVLRRIERDNSNRTQDIKEKTLKMNEELKVYCSQNSNNNIFYSDVLKGYDESDEMLISHTVDDDHPNEAGANIILNNIKANIINGQVLNIPNNIDISNDEEILKITAIDYNAIPNSGWGDGIMLSSNGYYLLMDTFREQCKDSLDKYLRENNISSFDIYISHDDHDHVDNLYYLIENYNVSKVYIPNLESFELFSVNKLKEKGVKEVIPLERGMTFEIGGKNCVAEVIYGPDKTPGLSDNNRSLVTMIRTKTKNGDVKYLTGGDIEEYAANKILEQGIDIKADIMKADHHGGGDTPEYIKKVNPSFYILDFLDEANRPFVKSQVNAAEECGNVFSTYTNGEISFSIKSSGNIVPTAQRNVEQVEFNVQDASGKTYTVTYTLNKDSSHILTDQMKATVTNEATVSTLNSTYKVKVATWSESLDKVESNDPAVTDYDTGFVPNMTTTTIPYQEIVSKYKMPFNYLWTMLVYSQDKDYTFDLADLVKNSKIEITIHDNLNETTNKVTDTYTNYTKIHAEADVKISYQNVSTIQDKVYNPSTGGEDIVTKEILTDSSTTKHGKADGEKWDPYYVIHTTITKTNTLDIALTLADAWCAKYEKKYTYNSPKTTESNISSTLDDISEDPYTNKGELGGQESKVDQDAVEQATYYDRRNVHATGERENEFATYKTTRITRVQNIYTKTTTSSYVAVPGNNSDNTLVTAATTPKTGQLNKDNYVEFVPEKQGDGSNHQQGFCFVGDDLIAYATVNERNGSEVCSLYLADAHTMKLCDSIEGKFSDHGNSIAYDSKTGDVIFPETGVMKLIKVNKTTKTFDKNNIRTQSLPEYERNTPSIAYNESKDLFISKDNVYTRTAFYSNGKPLKKIKHNMPAKNLDYSGATSFGNQVYYFYCDPSDRYAHGNYVVICNLETGNQEETLYDSTPREGEEISFTSDGTLYICYGYGKPNGKRGSVGTSFNKTDYNYNYDNNIDRSNVTSSNSNDVSQYTTGGKHTENLYFQKVFNSHYNARSNILSVEEWLYDSLEQNSDTVNMIDITKYLIARAKGAAEDRETFLAAIEKLAVYEMTQVGTETGGLLSITSTTFTREQFIQLVQSYSAAISNGSKTKDFRDNAGIIYDVCKKNNINPVLCAAQAWKEQNWVYPSTSKYNYWGIAVYNGQNYGSSYTSMEAAVENYCKNINQRLKGENGAEKWSKICAQYNNKFTGGINNLYDVLSNWACVKNADSNHPGQAEHASLYVDSVVKCATQIFGEGALTASGGGGDFLAVAQNIWKKICSGNYSYGGSSIPCTGSKIDCSSYASWVLYEYGYTDFKGGQHCTKDFKNTNWNQKYGWTEINVEGGQNPFSLLQPGDLFVRDPGNNYGHITLVVRKENGKIYCYDCGNSNNWRNNPNADALDKSYMLTDSRSGKIIRVTPKQ